MASSTMSVSMISFLPVGRMVGRPPSAAGSHSTSSTSTPQTLPFLPMNRLEANDQRRVHPSSWLEVVFRTTGHCGQGVASLWPMGGCGMISICVTLAAPCRTLVPMQSEPVSPPPMTSTRLPLALTSCSFGNVSPSRMRFCCVSISSAKWMPFSSRPGMTRSRAVGVPVQTA